MAFGRQQERKMRVVQNSKEQRGRGGGSKNFHKEEGGPVGRIGPSPVDMATVRPTPIRVQLPWLRSPWSTTVSYTRRMYLTGQ